MEKEAWIAASRHASLAAKGFITLLAMTAIFVIASEAKQSRVSLNMSEKIPCVYILANKRNGTIYTGVTSNLQKRLEEHRTGATDGFTKKYRVYRLVYYEIHETMLSAIAREKQLKGGSRKKKLASIEKHNPLWRDLSSEI